VRRIFSAILYIGAALALLLGYTGAVANAKSKGPSLTITIGVPVPLTGSQSDIGQTMLNGAKLAAMQAKGIQVKILPEDTACDPQIGTNAANQLVASHVTIVVGFYCSGAALPATTIFHRANMPVIITGAVDPGITAQGFPQVFRVIGTSQQEGLQAAAFMVHVLHAKTVALVDDNTAYAVGLEKATKAALAKYKGVKVVLVTAITPGTTDFGALISQINNIKPDVMYFTGYFPEGGLIAKQLYASGSKTLMMAGDGNLDPHFIKIAGAKAAARVIFTAEPITSQLPSAKAFIAQYERDFHSAPGPYSVYEYDGVRVAIAAVEAAHSTSPDAIEKALHRLHVEGVTGPISFGPNGQMLRTGYTEMVARDGQFFIRP
jgi:branched-chain amino acid transport system substrate-binding protein